MIKSHTPPRIVRLFGSRSSSRSTTETGPPPLTAIRFRSPPSGDRPLTRSRATSLAESLLRVSSRFRWPFLAVLGWICEKSGCVALPSGLRLQCDFGVVTQLFLESSEALNTQSQPSSPKWFPVSEPPHRSARPGFAGVKTVGGARGSRPIADALYNLPRLRPQRGRKRGRKWTNGQRGRGRHLLVSKNDGLSGWCVAPRGCRRMV